MVSYLIFRIIILGVLVLGIVYSFASDVVDFFIPIYSNSPLAQYNIPELQWGYDVVITIFKFVLVPALIGLIYLTIQMAQKPEQPWR